MQGGVLQTAAGGHVSQVSQTIILTVNPVTAFQVQGTVNSKPVLFMIDTGAAVCLIDCECWNHIKVAEDKLGRHCAPALVGVYGSSLQIQNWKFALKVRNLIYLLLW